MTFDEHGPRGGEMAEARGKTLSGSAPVIAKPVISTFHSFLRAVAAAGYCIVRIPSTLAG